MACVLTTGFTIDCRKSLGGVAQIYVGERDALNTTTFATVSGDVTVMAMTGGKKFYNYKVRKYTCEGKADNGGDVNLGAGYITHSVQIQLDRFETTKKNEMRILAQKPLMFILEDNNGNCHLFGAGNGLDLTTGTGGTGKEANSLSGFNLTFTGEELEYPYGISQAIIDTLIV